MSDGELFAPQREARLEAAPFAGAILVLNLALALVSRHARWELFGSRDWWVWLLLGGPSALLVATFLVGFGRMGLSHRRRELAIGLLGVLGTGTGAATACVIVSLTRWQPTGPQLLASAAVVLLTNVITFALVFWELDGGGPVARAEAEARRRPDFQFPQDDNPALATPGWAPTLADYVYVSVTNSIAFSPTDTMPLSRRAKLFMGLEAAISATTVLVVAARAVNVLG